MAPQSLRSVRAAQTTLSDTIMATVRACICCCAAVSKAPKLERGFASLRGVNRRMCRPIPTGCCSWPPLWCLPPRPSCDCCCSRVLPVCVFIYTGCASSACNHSSCLKPCDAPLALPRVAITLLKAATMGAHSSAYTSNSTALKTLQTW